MSTVNFPYSAYDLRTLSRRSVALLRSVARAAGEGIHHLTVAQVVPDGIDEAECIIEGPGLDEDTPNESVVKAAYMLAATVSAPAIVAVRTMDADGTVTFMSWAVFELVALPATAEQSHVVYGIGEDRDLTDPLPHVTFVDAPALI